VSIGLSAADAQTLQAYHSLSLSLSVAGRAGPIELFTIRIFGLLILPDYFNIDTWSLQNDNMDERFPRFWFEPVEHTAAADRAYQSKTLIKAVFTCTAYMYHSVNIHRTCRPYTSCMCDVRTGYTYMYDSVNTTANTYIILYGVHVCRACII